MHGHILTLGGIYIYRGVDLIVHVHLYEGGMEVSGIERQKFHFAAAAVEVLCGGLLLRTAAEGCRRAQRQDSLDLHCI